MQHSIEQQPAIDDVKEQDNAWFSTLKNAFYNAYEGIYNTCTSPFNALSTWWFGENQDKVKLQKMREHYYERISQEEHQANPDYVKISKDISQDTRNYINQILDEEVQKLGPLPCEFAVVTSGSLARSEAGPVTDLEIGFLIENKNMQSYQYFYELSQRVSDRLFLVCEHPDIGGKGMRIDEADNAPPHLKFFARNLTPEQCQQLLSEAIQNREWDKIPYEGSRPFLATPQEFAEYSRPDFAQDKKALQKQKRTEFRKELVRALREERRVTGKAVTAARRQEIKNEVEFWMNQMYRPFSTREAKIATEAGQQLGRNIDHLYGQAQLTKSFLAQRKQYFDAQSKECLGLTHRQHLARDCMISDVNDRILKGGSIYVTGELGKTIDLKRDLYRFTEQFVTNLGFYNECQSQNTLDITNELVDRQLMDPAMASNIQDLIQFATKLRLKQQKALGRQGFATYIDEEKFEEDKTDILEKIERLEQSIGHLERLNYKPETVAAKKRELNQLKIKYDHLLDMAPGLVLSADDLTLLRDTYAPLCREIFLAAQKWTENPNSMQPKVEPKAAELHPAIEHKHFHPMWQQLMAEIKAAPVYATRLSVDGEEMAARARLAAPAA